MVTEILAHPQQIRTELQFYQSHEFRDLLDAVASDRQLSVPLSLLNQELNAIIVRCSDNLTPVQVGAIVGAYDRWSERLEGIESDRFEEEILQAWMALPQ